eukprot:263640_1
MAVPSEPEEIVNDLVTLLQCPGCLSKFRNEANATLHVRTFPPCRSQRQFKIIQYSESDETKRFKERLAKLHRTDVNPRPHKRQRENTETPVTVTSQMPMSPSPFAPRKLFAQRTHSSDGKEDIRNVMRTANVSVDITSQELAKMSPEDKQRGGDKIGLKASSTSHSRTKTSSISAPESEPPQGNQDAPSSSEIDDLRCQQPASAAAPSTAPPPVAPARVASEGNIASSTSSSRANTSSLSAPESEPPQGNQDAPSSSEIDDLRCQQPASAAAPSTAPPPVAPAQVASEGNITKTKDTMCNVR